MLGSRAVASAALLCFALIAPSHSADAPSKESGSLLATLSGKENAFWTTFHKKDTAGFKKMVTDDFLNIDYTGGVASVAEVVGVMADLDIAEFKLSDFRVTQPAPDTAILVYHATVHMSYKGTSGPTDLLSTEVYVKRKGRWLAAMYHETAVPKQ